MEYITTLLSLSESGNKDLGYDLEIGGFCPLNMGDDGRYIVQCVCVCVCGGGGVKPGDQCRNPEAYCYDIEYCMRSM